MARAKNKDAEGCTLAVFERNYPEIIDDPKDADLLAVAKFSRDTIKSWKPGQGAKYPNTVTGLLMFQKACQEYFDHVISTNSNPELQHKVLLDIEGLCSFTGISRYTLREYIKRGGDWAEFINLVKQGILASKMQASATFRTPPVISIFDLTNNFGFVNSAEFKLNSHETTETDAEIRQQRIAELISELSGDHDADREPGEVILPEMDF